MNNDSFPRTHHDDMVENRKYGKLVIQYEAGNVTVVRKEETLKPPAENNRSTRQSGGK